MKCDRKVGLREITGAKNNHTKAAMGERRSADQMEKWGYIAVFPRACSQALAGCPSGPGEEGAGGSTGFWGCDTDLKCGFTAGPCAPGQSPPRGRRQPSRTGLMPAELPAHRGCACLQAHRLDYISPFPS